LESKTSSPDSGSEEEDNQTRDDGSVPSLERQLVGEETNDDGAGDGSETGEERDESSSSTVE